MIIRPVKLIDAESIAATYAHHVLNGTASFDTKPPSSADWLSKINAIISKSWPFLVAEKGGQIIGYAYATQFRDRPAYAETCENSIYVSASALGEGVGTALLNELLLSAAKSGFRQMIAVIGGGEPASVAVHVKLGFVHAGRMRNVGRKFGRLLDTVYMQRELTTK
jgi:L-amino acid N-acyltransferase YncA